MSMNIPDLEAFVAVVETGSIVAASTRLNVTQSAVTRRIQSLEDRLGQQLLNRSSKPLKPTSTGREAYEHGRRVLQSIDDLKAGISPGAEVRGEFRLGVMHYLSEAGLASPLDRLRNDFPLLSLHVVTGWSPQLLERVRRSELDAAAIVLDESVTLADGMCAEELGPQIFLLVASPSLGVPTLASMTDLSRVPWIMNEDGCGCRDSIRRRFEAARLPFAVSVEAANMELRLSLVARGLGLALVTPDALANSTWRDSVQIVEAEDFPVRQRAWMVHRAAVGRLGRPITLFRDTLQEELARFSSSKVLAKRQRRTHAKAPLRPERAAKLAAG